MKTKRTLTLVSGILLAIGAFSALLLAIIALIGARPLLNFLEEVSRTAYEELVNAGQMLVEDMQETLEFERLINAVVIYSFAISSLITGAINAVFGGLLIAHSRKSDEVVANKKALIITSLVYAILSSNIVVMVLLICALVQKTEYVSVQEQPTNTNPTEIVEVQSLDETSVDYKIKQLNILKETGAITKEEYVKLLKRILND